MGYIVVNGFESIIFIDISGNIRGYSVGIVMRRGVVSGRKFGFGGSWICCSCCYDGIIFGISIDCYSSSVCCRIIIIIISGVSSFGVISCISRVIFESDCRICGIIVFWIIRESCVGYCICVVGEGCVFIFIWGRVWIFVDGICGIEELV